MSTHKHIDRICVVITVLSLLIAVLFMNGEALGLTAAARTMGYENTLFDTSRVHTIDIVIDDWDAFLETAAGEEYTVCSVVIDNEAVKNVAIRGKGNTSLSTVATMGSQRYSLKLEIDHYEDGKTYKGLDKLCLNNMIQDNTYMKDYLAYRLMAEFGADAPLCSYVWVTVNGEDWGLYLAVEAVEDSFTERVYGGEGEIYKPDSLSMGGGGPGNGRDFNIEDFLDENADAMGFPWGGSEDGESAQTPSSDASDGGANAFPQPPGQSGSGGFSQRRSLVGLRRLTGRQSLRELSRRWPVRLVLLRADRRHGAALADGRPFPGRPRARPAGGVPVQKESLNGVNETQTDHAVCLRLLFGRK